MTNSLSSVPPTRVLRASLFSGQRTSIAQASYAPTIAFAFVLAAVAVQYCISGHVLNVIGFKYSDLGGSPFEKFHPATYLSILGAIATCYNKSELAYLFSTATTLFLFCLFIIFCVVFSAFNVGLTGAGVYIDTYLSAGALAIAMAKADDRQRMIVGRLILAFCVINILISLAEYVHQEHFIPLEFKNENGTLLTDNQSEEFRPAALYSHPLTGALATSLAIFLTLTIKLRFITKAIYFVIFTIGLLGFGGRAALIATIGVLGLKVIVSLARDMMRGRVNGRILAIVCLSVVTLGPLSAYLLTATPVGGRIAARSYYDDSAEVRATQWGVFDKLSPNQFMFGTPATDLEKIYEQVGLKGIENPFILIFLNLGIVGLPIFTCSMLAYFIYLRRAYPKSGWLVFSGVIILFSSNSIGVKGPDLFMMTACAVTMKGSFEGRSSKLKRIWSPSTLIKVRKGALTPGKPIRTTEMSVVRSHRGLTSNVTQLWKRDI